MSNRISLKHRRMYMTIAKAVAKFGTCDRARVGAVLVRNNAIIGTGFNGSASGDDHCDDVGHRMKGGHCTRAVHAELNALLNAAKNGAQTKDAVLFCTHEPCYRCCQHLINAGVSYVYYATRYGGADRDKELLCIKGKLTMFRD